MTLTRNSKLINKKFIAYLIPSILMIFAMQFSSLIDGIIIGNFLGSEALSATSLVSPILYIIQIPGFALGAGGSILINNLLGKRDVDKAKKVFSFCIIVGLALSLIFAILGPFISLPLARAFGEDLVKYNEPYILMYLVTDPLITLALLIAPLIYADNNPKISCAIYIVSNFAKVGLEILFIQVCKWGMYGAAASTGAGYFVGSLVGILYIRSKKRVLNFSFKIKDCGPKDILKTSSTYALNFLLTAIQMLIVNIFIGQLIVSAVDLGAYGLIANMVFLFDLFCGGVLNLIQTLCSLFYGEKDLYSLRSVTRKLFFINIIISVLLSVFIVAAPGVYSIIFGYNDTQNMEYVATLLRIYVISFIPYEINKFSMNYYPSIDKTSVSIVTVFSRELVVVLPVTISLLFTNGLMGYVVAAIITEAVSVIITYCYVYILNYKKKINHGIFMFEEGDVESFDVSVDNEIANASKISYELTEFARGKNIKEREAQVVGLVAEEIVNNIVTYGYKKGQKSSIDVNLKIVNDKLVLRIRDDGFPFDPTKYEYDNDEKYSTSGILLIKSMSDKMSYLRVLNLNNTVIEINLRGAN